MYEVRAGHSVDERDAVDGFSSSEHYQRAYDCDINLHLASRYCLLRQSLSASMDTAMTKLDRDRTLNHRVSHL